MFLSLGTLITFQMHEMIPTMHDMVDEQSREVRPGKDRLLSSSSSPLKKFIWLDLLKPVSPAISA